MLYITVHLFIHPNKVTQFRTYEAQALSIFRVYGGEVLLAFRPQDMKMATAVPHEIHVLSIKSQARFDAFRNDANYKALAELRDEVFSDVQLFFSDEVVIY